MRDDSNRHIQWNSDSSKDTVKDLVVQVSPAKAWAIVKSILFQLEHDAYFIEIAIVSKPEGANVDHSTK